MKSILHVLGAMDYGGAEISTISVMDSLKDNFKDVHFLTTSGRKGELSKELEQRGYIISPCNIYSIKFPILFIKYLKKNKISIVHSHISFISGYIMLLCYIARIEKRITHFRSAKTMSSDSLLKRVQTVILKLFVFIFSTNILAVNKASMKTHFKNYERYDKCRIMYNGKNTIKYKESKLKVKLLGCNENTKVITHIGRFHEAKNHEKIIRVFMEYNKINPNSLLILIGKNDTIIGKKIMNMVGKLELNESVKILGLKSNITDYLEISDLLLFPSHWEGLPGVVLESLSTGVPVLASDIEPHKEIRDTNRGITIISNKDMDYNWAKKMVEILKLGRREEIAIDFSESPYSFKQSIKAFENLYF